MLLRPVALALLATTSRLPLRQGLRVPDAHVNCRARAAPTMGFGLSDRESARFSQMKRTDEPLEEEVRGLYIVGATGGFVLGPLLFGSSFLGMIVGVQVGPSLAFTGGPRGERMRATGWESWRLWGIQVRRARRALVVARREAEARGLTPLLRRGSMGKQPPRGLCFGFGHLATWSSSAPRHTSARSRPGQPPSLASLASLASLSQLAGRGLFWLAGHAALVLLVGAPTACTGTVIHYSDTLACQPAH